MGQGAPARLWIAWTLAAGAACGSSEAPRLEPLRRPADAPRDASVLLFTGDYESGRIDEREYRLRLIGGGVSVVERPARTGRFAGRFTLEPDQERAELEPLIEKHPIGAERWYGFSLYLPADWEPIDANEVVAQWRHTNDAGETEGSPPLALRVDDDEWRINCRWDARRTSDKEEPEGKLELERIPFERGRWTDWVFHYRASFGPDGLIEAWKDGELVARHAGPNCYNDEVGLYFKWGIYHTQGSRVLYNDELRIGSERARWEDVAP